MNSPTQPTIWHRFAQGRDGFFMAFAIVSAARHCFRAGQRQPSQDLRSQRCYPSPSLRSGPSQAGPFLVRGGGHVCASGMRNCFEMPAIAVESAAITTNLRGSTKCRSRLSSSLSFPRPWPVACRTRRRAAWPVRPLALWSPMLWTRTCSQGPLWAGWLALPPVASRSACRPATRATDRLIERAALGRSDLTPRTIRADRPGGPFSLRLMGGADV
jgi:hypothetical protein